jgi:DtxR family Mn-dependent transcriptional regulator
LDNSQILLSKAPEGKSFEVIRLYGSDPDFFDFCKNNYLVVGTRIEVVKQYTRNGMTEIRVIGMKMLLNPDIGNRIYVKQIAPNY